MFTAPRILFLLFGLSMVLAVGCSARGSETASPTQQPVSSGAVAAIQEHGRLVVGVKFDQPGFGLKGADGKVDGFDVALAREVAKELGLREEQVELVEAVSAERIPMLEQGKVDLVVATMTITEERKQRIAFSRPYFVAGQSLLVRGEETEIRGVSDLSGKRVCTVAGSTSEQNVRARAATAVVTTQAGYAACVSALKAGSVDAVTTDDTILAGFAAADRTLKLVGGQFTTELYGVGMKREGTDQLRELVDRVINRMLSDGTWERLYGQYFGAVAGIPAASAARSAVPAR